MGSERQALALGNTDVFFIFQTFILIQISLLLVEKGQGMTLSVLEKRNGVTKSSIEDMAAQEEPELAWFSGCLEDTPTWATEIPDFT